MSRPTGRATTQCFVAGDCSKGQFAWWSPKAMLEDCSEEVVVTGQRGVPDKWRPGYAILLLSFLLLAWGLSAKGLWADELYSIDLARQAWIADSVYGYYRQSGTAPTCRSLLLSLFLIPLLGTISVISFVMPTITFIGVPNRTLFALPLAAGGYELVLQQGFVPQDSTYRWVKEGLLARETYEYKVVVSLYALEAPWLD